MTNDGSFFLFRKAAGVDSKSTKRHCRVEAVNNVSYAKCEIALVERGVICSEEEIRGSISNRSDELTVEAVGSCQQT